MASHEAVASYHASRFLPGEPVVEIGSGIGADTIAMARRGPVTSYEIDPNRVELAKHNLNAHGLDASIVPDCGLSAAGEAVFADPSRRSESQRRLKLADLEPIPFELVERFGNGRLLGIKLSPMTSDQDLGDLAGDRPMLTEFVSFGRECREALVWLGRSVTESETVAVHVESGSRIASAPLHSTVDLPHAWLYEADPAAVRAHALGAFEMDGLGESNGYLTSDDLVEHIWLRAYSVLYAGAGDVRTTAAKVKELGGGTPIVKQRAAGVDPIKLAKQAKGTGKRSLTVVVWAVGKSLKHAIVEGPMSVDAKDQPKARKARGENTMECQPATR